MQSGRQEIIHTTIERTRANEEALILEIKIPQRQRVEKIVCKDGPLTIGLCAGYEAAASQVGSAKDHFQALINYLQNLKQISSDFENYFICIFPNPRNEEKVEQYFDEIQDLLSHPILKGKVYVMGKEVQCGAITLRNYKEKDEENWKHALEHFSVLLEDETTLIKDKKFTAGEEKTMKQVLNELLHVDMKLYLKNNPEADPEAALKKLKEEVVFYIATGLRLHGDYHGGNVLLSKDKAPYLTMQFVLGNREAASKLERIRNSITHQEMSIKAKESELLEKEKPKIKEQESERVHLNNSNDVVDNIVNQLVRAEGVSADIKGAILASFAYELEKKKACERQSSKGNSTAVMMGKFAARSPKVSPGDSPRESKYQKTESESESAATAPFNDTEMQQTTSYSNNTNILYATRSSEHRPKITPESKPERMGVVYG